MWYCEGLFYGMILQSRCQSMIQGKGIKLGSIPPWTDHVVCPKLPSLQDASVLSPFVVFCPRLLLWHRSARFTLLSYGHCSILHPSCVPTAGNSVSNVSQRSQN